jgi:hypothetical protein
MKTTNQKNTDEIINVIGLTGLFLTIFALALINYLF